jgi:hypothetical protein
MTGHAETLNGNYTVTIDTKNRSLFAPQDVTTWIATRRK